MERLLIEVGDFVSLDCILVFLEGLSTVESSTLGCMVERLRGVVNNYSLLGTCLV